MILSRRRRRCRSATYATSQLHLRGDRQRAFTKHAQAIERAKNSSEATIIAGGVTDDHEGWFVRPTLIVSDNPRNEIFTTEYFGPILGIHVFEDADFESTLDEVDQASPYALTGAVIADDRAVLRPGESSAAARGRQLLPQ